jgi:hypothetical protein
MKRLARPFLILALGIAVACDSPTSTTTPTPAGAASLQAIQGLFVAPIAQIAAPASISSQWSSVYTCAAASSGANATTTATMPAPLIIFQSSADTIVANADSVNAYQLAPFPQYPTAAFLYQPSTNTTVAIVPAGFFTSADSTTNARLFDMDLIGFTLFTEGTTYTVPAACESQ